MSSSSSQRARRREDARRRDDAIAAQGYDRTFDGNWQGAAGQFLLRWYTHSSHHQRLAVISRGELVLAAPPRRVATGREKHMEIVARVPAHEAALVDPFNGEFETDLLLLRFRDGSWLRVETETYRSGLHMHLLRQPLAEG
ncbi:hypothetical protein ACFWZ2_23520 [Streptomyces sp. NPDC059002]|uniref:hypothetical protein n=1 Tax=Streptomyces sp. NPDC059002 TaxID=3346690 RepID=UPI0036AEB1AC